MKYTMNSLTNNIVAMGTEKYSLKAKAKSIGLHILFLLEKSVSHEINTC